MNPVLNFVRRIQNRTINPSDQLGLEDTEEEKEMKMNLWIVTLLVSIVPAFAFAHGNKVDTTSHALSTALQKFSQEEAANIPNFLGVKAWPDGHNIQVKVYLPENGVILYTCGEHEMDGQEMMMCTKQ